ncbi:GatB/YqeY domain-containing protein [Vagococcus vulneris]|uniref:Aspartyl-tRNA amidotransferase n=1 Tax=Vagococcus vulneris TaxID=1977869 RepID=A0A430A240_9ENTE|nr:GatB/YqeY domain-containing protein [Vagococcus vulneris]RSU00482.1 aspartyl-tRNA amidotransferase [Vagococcus vulneris]
MTLLTELNSDIKVAMKNKDREVLSVLRMMKSSLQNEEIKKGEPLIVDEELTVLSREVKQRKDSIEEFSKAGRDDLVEKTEAELAVVSRYLPEQLTDDELRRIITQVISETGASSMKEFGKVMSAVMPKVRGKADGQHVNVLVKELIS